MNMSSNNSANVTASRLQRSRRASTGANGGDTQPSAGGLPNQPRKNFNEDHQLHATRTISARTKITTVGSSESLHDVDEEEDFTRSNSSSFVKKESSFVPPLATTELAALEDAILEKHRPSSQRQSLSVGAHAVNHDNSNKLTTPHSGSTTAKASQALNELEVAIASKFAMTTPTATTTPTRTRLHALEQHVVTKVDMGHMLLVTPNTTCQHPPEMPLPETTHGSRQHEQQYNHPTRGSLSRTMSREQVIARLDQRIQQRIRNKQDDDKPITILTTVAFRDQDHPLEGDISDLETDLEEGDHPIPRFIPQPAPPTGTQPVPPPPPSHFVDPEDPSTYNNTTMNGEGRPKLAVAQIVQEEDDPHALAHTLPSAMEFDPESKPPIYKNRRFRLYGMAAIAVITLLIVGLTLGLTLGMDKSSSSSKRPPLPLSAREQLGLDQILEQVVGPDKLTVPGSPHQQALNWIIHEDPRQLEPSSKDLVQRFLLALFYFSTVGEEGWRSCNPPEEEEDNHCLYQVLVQYPDEFRSIPSTRWLTSAHECEWAGVLCNGSEIVNGVDIAGQNLSGPLPEDLALMPYLQSISLKFNNFRGTIPDAWAGLRHVMSVDLQHNQLSGGFPQVLFEMGTLQTLNLAENEFQGTIPSVLGQATGLTKLVLHDNTFTGSLPTELGYLEALNVLRVDRNQLTSTIPSEFGNLSRIATLWCSRNRFTSTIPSELGRLESLGVLRLHYTEMTGTIPEELYSSTALKSLDLYDSNFTGTISPMVGSATGLEKLRLRNNRFHGILPTELGLLTNLQELWLQFNDFTGEVPQEVCDIRSPFTLSVLDADCASPNGIGEPPIECPVGCCSRCCDAVIEECT